MRPLLLLPFLSACASDYEVTGQPVDVDPGDVTECGFTRVGETDFWAYDCNPVFTGTDEDWADGIRGTTFLVTEVLGHPFYQLWYVGVPDGTDEEFGLGYAVSADGTSWETHPDNPLLSEPKDRDAWDADAIDGLQVVWDPATEQYVGLYQGYDLEGELDWGLGVLTSPDGVGWERLASNPVVNLTEGRDEVVQWCWPLGLSLGDVAGFTGYVAGATRTQHCEVYRINASDVRTWEPGTQQVLAAGESGAWDDEGFSSLAIAELAGERHMFYVGFGDWEEYPGYRVAQHAFLGMATHDGDAWVKDPEPIPISNSDEGLVSAVAARTVGSRIHLWVTDQWDGEQAVGYYLYDPHREEEAE